MTGLFLAEKVVSYFLYATGVYWLVRRRLRRRGAAVVLVYHRVLSGERGLGEMVGEAAFEWQMKYLSERCRPVEWSAMRESGGAGVRVLVTFDDGYRDNFTRALPIMERHQIPGVFFLLTDLVFDRSEGERVGEAPTKEELQTAARATRVTFGNHTASHPFVSRISVEEFDRELSRSQTRIREEMAVTPDLFAYPRGRARDVSEEAALVLSKHGFTAAFTMMPGLVKDDTPQFRVPRIGMSHVNDRVVFKVKMLGLLAPLVRLKNALGA